ncbi:MAG: hypothetical protein COA66_06240 [Arcobacter sp.]|nr:MAG: hypothetical protein COA66_06240 [Arcobacter sp.]
MNTMREDLIQIATKKIQESGINSLTMRDLGKTVGIKASSVMYHFNSKDELLHELIKTYSEGFVVYLNKINEENLDKKVRLNKFINIFELLFQEDKICLAGMFAVQNKNLDSNTIDKTSDFFAFAQTWLASNLDVKDSMQIAKVIVSSLEGALMLDKLNKNKECLAAVKIWIKNLQP